METKQTPVIMFMHGAGCHMQHEFMEYFAQRLSQQAAVVRFDFAYMQQQRQLHRKRPPAPLAQLTAQLREQVAPWRAHPLWLMGKSKGSRVALTVADEVQAQGVIALGFPFHPQGKPQNCRAAEFSQCLRPIHIFQGELDPLGDRSFVQSLQLPAHCHIQWYQQADHDLVAKTRSGLAREAHWETICQQITSIIHV